MRIKLSDAKNETSGISRVLNLAPTDPRWVGYLNESIQRLIQTGELFYGSHQRIQFCVTDGCVTWPRSVASIEAAAVCGSPITIRNGWFEYLETGYGLQSGDSGCSSGNCSGSPWGPCGGGDLYDRGNACTFADIIGASKKIRVYADVAEDAAAKILLFGNDENGNWIRSESSPGVWHDGLYVSLSGGPNLSSKFFTALTGVQKPVTKGAIRLYEYDTVLTTQRALAVYEPTETNPSYRRSFIGSICPGADCDTVQVMVMAKLEFIPVSADTDWLLIGNLPAIKDMCQSILKSERNLFDESVQWEARAVQALRRELSHYRGHGVVQPIRMVPRNIGGPAVANMI